jgi:protein-L-isoaspartate(D-aspartate) O-methyltransferase
MSSLQEWRSFYAEFVVKAAGSADARLIAAFAAVPREQYVGPGPWAICAGDGYLRTPSADPRFLYQDILVALDTERRIHNGEPSLHALCLAAAAPNDGDHAVHIGAGTGYYTAILAHLVGDAGRVLAIEIDPKLAASAKHNLCSFANCQVINASGAEIALPPSEVIYVSAGATHPLASWLDALKLGGRLILPLTTGDGAGCMLLVTHTARDQYAASVISRASFIPCVGARDESASQSLAAALERGSLESVRSLRRGTVPDQTAWCVGTDWWLSTAPA